MTVLVSIFAVAALVAPTGAAVADDPKAITPIQVIEMPTAPLRDPLGTPSASAFVSADTLLTTSGTERSAVQASADLTTATSTGSADNAARQLNQGQTIATAAGRFIDDAAERALALQVGDTVRNGVLVLNSASAPLEGQTRGAKLTAVPIGGMALQLAACAAAVCNPKNFLTMPWNQSQGFSTPPAAVADPGVAGSEESVWTLRESDGAFQFVSVLNGLCLAADGAQAVTVPCEFGVRPPSPTQLWQIAVAADGVATIRSSAAPEAGVLYLASVFHDPDARTFRIGAADSSDSLGAAFGLFPIQQSGGVLPTWSSPSATANPGLGFDLATGASIALWWPEAIATKRPSPVWATTASCTSRSSTTTSRRG